MSYRPDTLENYIGQDSIKRNLSIVLGAAKAENRPVGHVIVYGPPGTGKTTIARIIAFETGGKLHSVIGPALQTVADLVSMLRGVKEGDVLFVDEIHALPRKVEEVLYTAMEDRKIDIVVGEGFKMNLSIALPRFTVVGATTRMSKVTQPLRDRFASAFRVEYYSNEDLADIIAQSLAKGNRKASSEAVLEIARRSRGTPRIALKNIERAFDFSISLGVELDLNSAREAMVSLGIDEKGLNQDDLDYLVALCDKFEGGPAGVSALASVMNREEGDLDSMIEPWLLRCGFIQRTPRGRVLTSSGYKHIGRESTKADDGIQGR